MNRLAGAIACIVATALIGGQEPNVIRPPLEPIPGKLPPRVWDWIKTHAVFFEGRFRADLERRSERTNGVWWHRADHLGFLFYKEAATSIRVTWSF